MDKRESFIQRAGEEQQQQDPLFSEEEQTHEQPQSRIGPSVGQIKGVSLHSSEIQGIVNDKGDKDESA